MNNFNDKSLVPLTFGSELQHQDFKLTQYDMTFLLSAPRYRLFYQTYIKNRIMMYRGWIDGFHNIEYGIIPTYFLQRIGNGIVNTLFTKPPVLNTESKESGAVISEKYEKSNFNPSIKEVYGFAIEGGAGLIKWNRDGNNQLVCETVPMDKFFITVDAYGRIERVRSFLVTYNDTIHASREYHLCEERFFKYANVGGEQKRFPMIHYVVYQTSSNIHYESVPQIQESLRWQDIPPDVRLMLKNDYGDLMINFYDSEGKVKGKTRDGMTVDFGNCALLPFDDDLGARVIKFTPSIPGFPKMPFGQPLADLIMSEAYAYDQLKAFERFEVHAARARIMVDKGYVNPNDPASRKNLMDSYVINYYDSPTGESTNRTPETLQPELRAEHIKSQKQNILNDVAFALGLSSSTIAAWLSDGTTQKTATEIESEKTKTGTFINNKLEIIQQPLQEMIDLFFHYYGVSAPELKLIPETQTVESEGIRLYSELFDKKQIPADMLASKILGTCSVEELNKLTAFIEQQAVVREREQQEQMAILQSLNNKGGPT